MSSRSDQAYLKDILEACQRACAYTADMTFEQFLTDTKTQDAVIRNVEIIGEAIKQLTDAVTERHTDIPWSQAARMRDRLIHHYFGINLDVVWSVIREDLPVLRQQIQEIVD